MDPPQVLYLESKSNNMAVASLVLGLVGILGAMIPIMYFVGWGLGVTGLVLGFVALAKAKQLGGVHKTMSKWGIALSIASIGMGTVGFVIVQQTVNDLDKSLNEVSQEFDQSSQDFAAYSKCIDQAQTYEEFDDCG